MYWKLFVSLLPHLFVCNTLARSVIYENVEDDVSAVGSFIREVRQLAPLKVAMEFRDLMSAGNAPKAQKTKNMKNASGKSDEGGYYRTYGSDADGEKGYLKETYGKGDHGYKTLDTFHKQDGDKYDFETQTSYGKTLTADKKRHNEKKKHQDDHEGAGTMIDMDHVGDATDQDEASEYSQYGGGDDGDHYSSHYEEEKEPESSNYNESYSSGEGDEESYETHSSYNSDGEGEGEEEHD